MRTNYVFTEADVEQKRSGLRLFDTFDRMWLSLIVYGMLWCLVTLCYDSPVDPGTSRCALIKLMVGSWELNVH